MRLTLAVLVLVLAAAAAPAQRLSPLEWQISGRLVQGGIVFGTAPPGTVAVTAGDVAVRLTGDRRFIAGLGRDAAPELVVTARLADGSSDVRTVAVAPRQWAIESIPSLVQPPADAPPNPEYDARRLVETTRIATARAGQSDATGWTQAFAWPATGRISGVYGSQRILGGVPRSPHFGVDVAAPSGTPVLAPARGVVRLTGEKFALEGDVVMIDHGHGLVSSFLHLSRIDVAEGQRVERGEQLGAIGMTGRATGPHLHWGMSWGEVRLDPALMVPPMPAG